MMYHTFANKLALAATVLAEPSIWPWLVLIGSLCFGVPGGRIIRRAGYSAWWGIVLCVPVLGLIALWVFAFSRWPALNRSRLIPKTPNFQRRYPNIREAALAAKGMIESGDLKHVWVEGPDHLFYDESEIDKLL